MPSPGVLCTSCSKLPPQLFLPGYAVSHPIDLRSISQNPETCSLCGILYGAIGTITDFSNSDPSEQLCLKAEWARSKLTSFQGWLAAYWGDRRACRWRFTTAFDTEGYNALDEDAPSIYARATHRFDFPNLRERHTPPESAPKQLSPASDSDECFTLMNRWLDECMERHMDCKVTGLHVEQSGLLFPPKRLIDLDALRLVDTPTISLSPDGYGPPYVALSHCWGDPKLMPICTTANLQQLQKHIDLESLTKTFQDAITVARKIRVRYLWIDSLCIIQDDPNDKIDEVARMSQIYSMSICTIVAAAARDGSGGCFVKRQTHEAKTCSMRLQHDAQTFTVSVYPYLSDFFDMVSNGPVSTRGWCFQERQLSKRVLYFTEKCIAWECRSAVATEDQPAMASRAWRDTSARDTQGPNRILDCVPAGVSFTEPNWLTDTAVRNILIQHDARFKSCSTMSHYRHWMDKWCPIVEEYSTRNLGSETDRLPALGGLASLIAPLLQTPFDPQAHTYLAGIWLADLPRQLCWFPNLQDPRSRRTLPRNTPWPPPLREYPPSPFSSTPSSSSQNQPQTLPSWSWISTPGPVAYYDISTFIAASEADLDPDEAAQDTGLTISTGPPDNLKRIPLTLADLAPRTLSCYTTLSVSSYLFGAVTSGVITLRGLAVELEIDEGDFVGEGVMGVRSGWGVTATLKGRRGGVVLPKCYVMFPDTKRKVMGGLGVGRRMPGKVVGLEGVVYFDVDPVTLGDKTRVVCLRLGCKRSLVTSMQPVDVGLVLMRVDSRVGKEGKGKGKGKGVGEGEGARFRRVGMYEIGMGNKGFYERAGIKEVVII